MIRRPLLMLFGMMAAMLTACAAFAAPPAPNGPTIPAAQLQADARILRTAYDTLHPGLYRYRTPEEISALYAQLDEQLAHDLPLGAAFVAFSEFAAQLRCGHSYCNFWNQPKSVASVLFERADRLPFHFRWLEGRMIVTTNRSAEPQLVPGAQILTIDDIPAEAILARLLRIARADGGNDAKRVRYLEINGDTEYEAFDIFFPLYFHGAPEYSLRILSPGATEPRTVRVAALNLEQRRAPMQEAARRSEAGEPIWNFELRPDGIAMLTMPAWDLFNTTWDWSAWLTERFAELDHAHAAALIIDLRGNEGGLDCGNPIIAHLIDRQIPFGSLRRYVRYVKTPAALDPYLDTWDDSFRDRGAAAQPAATPKILRGTPPGQFYTLDVSGDGVSFIEPQGPRFSGRVIVLIDAWCSSATYQFAKVVKEQRLGTLVGETTGGSQRGINGGSFFFLRLPNSQIELDLPLVALFPPDDVTPPDAGIEPDLFVPTTIDDVAHGRDPQMHAALRLAAPHREQP